MVGRRRRLRWGVLLLLAAAVWSRLADSFSCLSFFCQNLRTMGVIRPQNMNDIFQAAANQARQKLPELSHNQKVRAGGRSGIPIVPAAFGRFETHSLTHLAYLSPLQVAKLYRTSLRVLLSWAVDRDIFNDAATDLRARFDANRGVSPSAASRLLREGEGELFSWSHPDMYKVPFMPGGSKFMRNPPLPMSVCFPDGNIPADAPTYEVNPDMSVAKPETGRNAVGTTLVDFYKKRYVLPKESPPLRPCPPVVGISPQFTT
jgi:NADH dehydrogenase (ubiquinone) 1 beta subcomplex subunit 9